MTSQNPLWCHRGLPRAALYSNRSLEQWSNTSGPERNPQTLRSDGENRASIENTDNCDAIFFITKHGINPYLYSGFLWARCSPWDIEQRVGPSALAIHLTGDVSSGYPVWKSLERAGGRWLPSGCLPDRIAQPQSIHIIHIFYYLVLMNTLFLFCLINMSQMMFNLCQVFLASVLPKT